MTRAGRHRRAFTLIEAVVVVVVLAVSVPPTVAWLNDAAGRRADAVNSVRAAALATCVLENVLADASSSAAGLGFGAFANPPAYLDTPATGLRARLATQTQGLESIGFTYGVEIGPLVDSTGVVNAAPANNLFRRVRVTVSMPRAEGPPAAVAVEAMVTQL